MTHQLVRPRARVVVAVSGGADSVALLHLLTQLRAAWDLTLHIAHLNHGLRAAAADDAEFVRALGARWQIATTVETRDVGAACAREGWSLEEGARRVRYAFLLEVAARELAETIVTAHTADDQAETVLMRLIRGTGLMGLGAIPMKRRLEDCWIVRPLLDVWRREILEYLQAVRVTYREDATNRDSRFVRNRIRHELLPLLERDYNPNVKGALTQLAEQSHWDYAYLQRAAERQWKRTVKVRLPAAVEISVAAFLHQPPALQRQLLRHTVQQIKGDVRAFEFRHWMEVQRLFTERPVGTVLDLPGGVQLRRGHDDVVCRMATPCVEEKSHGILPRPMTAPLMVHSALECS
jgi:tRNA(Ile)-lysidine synthase